MTGNPSGPMNLAENRLPRSLPHGRRQLVFAFIFSLLAALSGVANPAGAAPSGLVAWVGSPIVGTVSSAPPHTQPYGEQWALDIRRSSSADVKVYVAADPARDPRISTRILRVSYACGAKAGETAAQRLARGGKRVLVGVYYDYSSTTSRRLIGYIDYSHVNTSRAIGDYNVAVSRWGGSVGTMGTNYISNSCWTGPHVHLGMRNTSGTSCYWAGLTTGRGLSTSQYIGYLGYNNGTPVRACPSGL